MIIFIIDLILTIVFLILMCRENENSVFIAVAVGLSCLLIDAMFGCSTIEVSEQEIEALKCGKVLYFNDGTSAMGSMQR